MKSAKCITLMVCIIYVNTAPLKRVCYYPFEGLEPEKLTPDKLNATLCTHIIFESVAVYNSSVRPGSLDPRAFKLFNTLKKQEPNLKLTLSFGDSGNDLGFSNMISTYENRQRFIKNATDYLRQNSLDGLDFDWEYPVANSKRLEDRPNFSQFLAEMKQAFIKEASISKRDRLTISAAVIALDPLMSIYYDIKSISESLDYINVMTYDMHMYRDSFPFTGYNSPLFALDSEKGYFGGFNIAWAAYAWHRYGAPKEKIILGLPTYAHTFKLLDSSKNGPFAPALGTSFGSSEIRYPTVCKFLKTAVIKRDAVAGVPYAYNDTVWISYDDQESTQLKSQWIKKNGYGGAMTFSLQADDWAGVCGEGKFPLHTVMYKVLAHDN